MVVEPRVSPEQSSDPPFAGLARDGELCGSERMRYAGDGWLDPLYGANDCAQDLGYDPVQAGEWMAWQGLIRPFEASV